MESQKPRTPKVLNRNRTQRTKGVVYIGRPSKWGNPFVIGPDGSREDVIQKYRAWLYSRPDIMAEARRELKGQDLLCYCAPKTCHGDVLLGIANDDPAELLRHLLS
jgi:hypothetical protein